MQLDDPSGPCAIPDGSAAVRIDWGVHLTDQLTIVVHTDEVAADYEVAALVASGVEVIRSEVRRIVSGDDGRVAAGGSLLVVSHDLTPWSTPIGVAEQTRMFDPDAYLGIDEIAAAITDDPDWEVEPHETRLRQPGAASAHQHVDDVVLRARRRTAQLRTRRSRKQAEGEVRQRRRRR